MYESLWVSQQLVDQRTAEREAEAAAHRLAKQVQRDRGNPRRRFFCFRWDRRTAPAVDARLAINPPANLITSPELVDAAATKPWPQLQETRT
jgi:hypothetical protein